MPVCMCKCMGATMCKYMHTGVRIGMRIGTHAGICLDMCMGTRMGTGYCMCVQLRIARCADTRMGMRTGVCLGACMRGVQTSEPGMCTALANRKDWCAPHHSEAPMAHFRVPRAVQWPVSVIVFIAAAYVKIGCSLSYCKLCAEVTHRP